MSNPYGFAMAGSVGSNYQPSESRAGTEASPIPQSQQSAFAPSAPAVPSSFSPFGTGTTGSTSTAGGGRKPKKMTAPQAIQLAALSHPQLSSERAQHDLHHAWAFEPETVGATYGNIPEQLAAYMNQPRAKGERIAPPMPPQKRALMSYMAKRNAQSNVQIAEGVSKATKGTTASKAFYGDTLFKANKEQLRNRFIANGYSGRGRYDMSGAASGQGSFWDDILGNLKTVGQVLLNPMVGLGAEALNAIAPGAGTALKPVALSIGNSLLGTGAYNDNGEELLVSMNPEGLPEAVTTESGANSGVGVVGNRQAQLLSQQKSRTSLADAQENMWQSDNPAQYMPNKLDDMRAPMPKYDRQTEIVNTGRLRFSKNIIDSERVQFNNIVNHGQHNSRVPPRIRSVGDETADLVFTHNEYLRDITSASPMFHTAALIEINPALFRSFPLLSKFASKYSEYDFIQCIFHFKSLVTDGNSSAAGSVMLVPAYNPADPPMSDKRGVENSEGAVSDKVTCDLVCGIECDDKKVAFGGLKYTRDVEVDPIGRRQYDVGTLQVALQGVPEGFVIGELWCSYQVRLSKLRVQQNSPLETNDGCTIAVSGIKPVAIGNNAYNDMTKPHRLNLFQMSNKDRSVTDFVDVHQNLAPDFRVKYTSTDEQVSAFSQGDRNNPTAGYIEFDMAIVGGSVFDAIFDVPFMWDPQQGFRNINDCVPLLMDRMAKSGPNRDTHILTPILQNINCTVPMKQHEVTREYFIAHWPHDDGNGNKDPMNVVVYTARVRVRIQLDLAGTQGNMSGRIGLNILDGYAMPVQGVLYDPYIVRDNSSRATVHFTFVRVK